MREDIRELKNEVKLLNVRIEEVNQSLNAKIDHAFFTVNKRLDEFILDVNCGRDILCHHPFLSHLLKQESTSFEMVIPRPLSNSKPIPSFTTQFFLTILQLLINLSIK